MNQTTASPILEPTLSARLIDDEYREGFEVGYRAGVAALLARVDQLLDRTAALNDLQTTAVRLRGGIGEELTRGALPQVTIGASATGSVGSVANEELHPAMREMRDAIEKARRLTGKP